MQTICIDASNDLLNCESRNWYEQRNEWRKKTNPYTHSVKQNHRLYFSPF